MPSNERLSGGAETIERETSAENSKSEFLHALYDKYNPDLIAAAAKRMGLDTMDDVIADLSSGTFTRIDGDAFEQAVLHEVFTNGSAYTVKEGGSTVGDFLQQAQKNEEEAAEAQPVAEKPAETAAPAVEKAPEPVAEAPVAASAPQSEAAEAATNEQPRGVNSQELHEGASASARSLSWEEIGQLVGFDNPTVRQHLSNEQIEEAKLNQTIEAAKPAVEQQAEANPATPETSQPNLEAMERVFNDIMQPGYLNEVSRAIANGEALPEGLTDLLNTDTETLRKMCSTHEGDKEKLDGAMWSRLMVLKARVDVANVITRNDTVKETTLSEFGTSEEGSSELPTQVVAQEAVVEEQASLAERVEKKTFLKRIGSKITSFFGKMDKYKNTSRPFRSRAAAVAMMACMALTGCASQSNNENTVNRTSGNALEQSVDDDELGEISDSDAAKAVEEALASAGEADKASLEALDLLSYDFHEGGEYTLGNYYAGTYANENGCGPLGFDVNGQNVEHLKRSAGSVMPESFLESGATAESAHRIVQASLDMAPFAAINVAGFAEQYNSFMDAGNEEGAALAKRYIPDCFIVDGRAVTDTNAIQRHFAESPDDLKGFASRLNSFFGDTEGHRGTTDSLELNAGQTVKNCYVDYIGGSGPFYQAKLDASNTRAAFRDQVLNQNEQLLIWTIQTKEGSAVTMTYMEACGNYVSYDKETETTIVTTEPVVTTTNNETTTTTTTVTSTPESTTTEVSTTTTDEETKTTTTTTVTTTETSDSTTTTTSTTSTPPGLTTTTTEVTTTEGTTTTEPVTTTQIETKNVEHIKEVVGTDAVPLDAGELTESPYVPQEESTPNWVTPEYEQEHEKAAEEAVEVPGIQDSVAANEKAAEEAAAAEAQKKTDEAYEAGTGSQNETKSGDQLADLLNMLNSQLNNLNSESAPAQEAAPTARTNEAAIVPEQQTASAPAAGLDESRPSITG